jgi:hypothetical protein
MIAPQSPPPQVLISAQSVLAVDVPSQRLPSVAAVQTNHIILAHGTSYRHSRSMSFLGLNGAMHLEGHLAELDINPLMVLPSGQGVKAVDALVVLRGT